MADDDRRHSERGNDRQQYRRSGQEGRGRGSNSDRNGGYGRSGGYDRSGGQRRRDDRGAGSRSGDRDRRFNDRQPYDRSDRDPRRKDQDPAGRFDRGQRDQRSNRDGYRPSRPKAPEIDEEVTGRELDRSVLSELRVLEKDNADVVAKHLVMASQYLEVDPEFALEHAQAAVRRGGRVAAVREGAAIAAYVAERFDVALRELRTHRRMTGSHEHIALIVDCERALGRIDKALETASDPELSDLRGAEKVELAMVVAGIHRDRGDLATAKKALEIPELNRQKAFSYSPRLFSAYADLLEEMGETKDAASWARLAVVAEAALGQGQFEDPEIYEIDVLPDEESVDTATGEQGVDLDEAMIEQRQTREPQPTDDLSETDHEEFTPSESAVADGVASVEDETGKDPESEPVQEPERKDD